MRGGNQKLKLAEALNLESYFLDTTCVKLNIHYRMSSLKLVYSAGVNPARARVRGPVTWIVRRKETES